MDETRRIQVRHLWEVEGLSMRQIAKKLHMSRKTVGKIIGGEKPPKRFSPLLLTPYERLIGEWYKDYPFLKATQVYEKLKEYDFGGSYETVKRGTMKFRQKRKESFHELEFLPGEEAKIDWMVWRVPEGPVYGFMFLLAWSRYLCVKFYPRHSLEFFLDGHLEAYREINGIARRNRYDNLKSVVIKRRPELKLNPQFLDFSLHHGFSIHLCSPRRANKKGRVERVIRDAKNFLRVTPVEDLKDLNKRIYQLMKGMAKEVEHFLMQAEKEGQNSLEAASQLFRLFRANSKETFLSAVREANSLDVHKVRYIQSLLQPPCPEEPHPVNPQDKKLLDISYKQRKLDDYDELI